jgi:AcrR family transcriptional regulator
MDLESRTIGRQERRKLETRARIVAAAGLLFGERGVRGVTVADICESADLARQTFFNHFGGKEELVGELVGVGWEFVATSAREANDLGGSTRSKLSAFFSRMIGAAAGTGVMHHELMVETLRHSAAEATREKLEGLRQAIQTLIGAGVAAGDVTDQRPPEDLTLMVVGTLQMLMFEWSQAPDYPIAERTERMAQLLADAIAPDRYPG